MLIAKSNETTTLKTSQKVLWWNVEDISQRDDRFSDRSQINILCLNIDTGKLSLMPHLGYNSNARPCHPFVWRGAKRWCLLAISAAFWSYGGNIPTENTYSSSTFILLFSFRIYRGIALFLCQLVNDYQKQAEISNF